jgi:hypothetical protein
MYTLRTLAAMAVLSWGVGALVPAPLRADDVYLKNGRSFTGVVAEVGETQVRIEMPGGSLSLPLSAVDRVEKSGSTFGGFLERKQELLAAEAHARGERHATDWLDLARWAKRNGFTQGAREAALVAAEIDPHVDGLAPILVPMGYVFAQKQDRWVSFEESMRMQGFVQDGNGQWVSREQYAAEQAASRQAWLAQQQAATAAAAQAGDEVAYQAAIAQQAAGDFSNSNAYPGDAWPILYGGGIAVPGYGAYGYGRYARRGQAFGAARIGPPFRQPGSLPMSHPRAGHFAGGGAHGGGGGGHAGGVRR